MPIQVIAVGKKHESWVEEGIQRYQKRLKMPFMVEWVLLPHSNFDGLKARQEESGRLLSRLKRDDVVVLLDERGKQLNSPALSTLITSEVSNSRNLVFIIGGAYGVDETIHRRAQKIWSLSDLVFPHQLVRLLLVEQIYRAQEIASGGAYHHD
ncbi:MAG: 23S rRNA (pseudouridine(1915)-N(3))-methyltransferase RlmH [Candidatus Microsaccharimonas sp.]